MSDANSEIGAFEIPQSSNPVLAWLQADGVMFRDTAPFFEAYCGELLSAGVDIWRATTGVHVLHPQIDSLICLWKRDKPIFERRFKLDAAGAQQFKNSPMVAVYGGRSVRGRLEAPPAPDEFPIYADLRADGITDYIAWPLPFSDGTWKAITYATRRRGGFPPEQIRLLQELVPTFSRLLEIQTLHRTTLTLLNTYVGHVAGRRVLDGAIKRGMYENINAVIWICDLRGFTELSESLPGGALVNHLNDSFGAMAGAVGNHDGEVLKFIGDAMLAIFPLSGDTGATAAKRALQAAYEAALSIATINEEHGRAGTPPIRFGLALHVGEVLYGNIGGPDRLDFTVIGRAVNVAARIESLCKITGRSILMSGEFTELLGEPVEPLGKFPLKGVGTEQPVYAPIGKPV
jgi:adenylate cyclase